METSLFLGRVMGPLLILISIGLLANANKLNKVVNELINNVASVFILGVFNALLGLSIVVSHNVWDVSWKVLITLLGWFIMLKGVSAVIAPTRVAQMTKKINTSPRIYQVAGAVDFVLGVYLCVVSYGNVSLFG